MTRADGRADVELRPVTFERDYTEMADGSCLVTFGRTKVLCTASVDDSVPRWMRGSGKGWVTAEYSMLPGSSPERVDREAAKGKQSGRTVEIQRLIGRSLRAACDLTVLGERQVVVDCDVLQADGGTRTASICGGFLALHDALARLVASAALAAHPLHSFCAAVSVGIVGGVPVLDLPYSEDSTADVDMNVVTIRPIAGGETRFVEVQGTAEGAPFSHSELAHVARPGRTRARRDRRSPGRDDRRATPRPKAVTAFGHRRPRQLVCASANPSKVAEIVGILGGAIELLPRPSTYPGRRRGRRHARRQRPSEGGGDRRGQRRCPASPTTPVWRSPHSAACPESTRRRMPDQEPPTRRTGRSCSPPSPASRRSARPLPDDRHGGLAGR